MRELFGILDHFAETRNDFDFPAQQHSTQLFQPDIGNGQLR